MRLEVRSCATRCADRSFQDESTPPRPPKGTGSVTHTTHPQVSSDVVDDCLWRRSPLGFWRKTIFFFFWMRYTHDGTNSSQSLKHVKHQRDTPNPRIRTTFRTVSLNPCGTKGCRAAWFRAMHTTPCASYRRTRRPQKETQGVDPGTP